MTLNSRSSSWFAKAVRTLTKGASGVALLAAASGITAGCLKRPVAPAVPQTTNVYINQLRQTGVDKIDLLFMIDNSISMSDKQKILEDAIPVLVQRLITPVCVNPDGATGTQGANGACAPGFAPEFKPIKNIHIGVITSSLGDHGSNDVCSDAQNLANMAEGGPASFYNDKAQLLPTVRTGLTSWDNSGFLVWDPRVQADVLPEDRHPNLTPNETQAGPFVEAFKSQVVAAGEHGCGYESSLEAWYRFLVDPEPAVTVTSNGAVTLRDGPANDVVLAARARFLRPDSLLAIILLSDENDCSIIDEKEQQGWLVGYKGGVSGSSLWHMPRATAVCATNPNDACCHPCSEVPTKGCADDSTDAACSANYSLTLPEDSMNMRCFNQARRFGIDLLYPTGRYVEALSKTVITPRFGGTQVPNPIYQAKGGAVPRDAGLVFFAGIVGIPWQDVSTEESWNAPRTLKYLSAREIASSNRWDVILGTPGANNGNPTDTLMVESIDPRNIAPYPQAHPLLPSVVIGSPTATTNTNTINGHEQVVSAQRDDLQFACIFKLETPTPCTDANADACDCNYDEFGKNSPLCQGVTATADGTQASAKAYPGIRHLQVLKDFGDNAIVASICPKNTTAMGGEAADPNYGYNPAVAAIVDRLKEALTVKCLPRPLAPGRACEEGDQSADCAPESEVGKVPCAVVEVRPPGAMGCTSCGEQNGRLTLEGGREKIIPAAQEYLHNVGYCDGPGQASCKSYCMCELNQFTNMQDINMNNDPDLDECKTTPTDPGNMFGYCYVDPAASRAAGADQEIIEGEEALVKDCKSSEQRILRFLGENVPAKDGLAFIACIGAAASQ